MSFNFDEIVNDAFEETDGQNNFARINLTMSDTIACIRPYALSVLSYTLFVKCLAKVPRYIELTNNDIGSCVDGEVDKGRWSFILTSSDLIEETTFNGDEHNINKNIRTLLKSHMFFRFEVPVGKTCACIYTYNRYPILTGLFWKQNDLDCSPPVTPKIISVLSSMKSYKNALSRLCKPLHNKMRSSEGWETLLQVENRVKEAFCCSFLKELIAGSSNAVKSHFKTFEESKMDYDEYVMYVWKTAKELPPYEGINITTDFLLGLRLPQKYISKLQKVFLSESKKSRNSASSKKNNEIKILSSGVNSTPQDKKKGNSSGVNSTPQKELQGVNSTPQYRFTGVNSTPQNRGVNGVKIMNTNKLRENDNNDQRIIHNIKEDNIKKRDHNLSHSVDFESTSNTLNNEILDEIKANKKPYNQDMNTKQIDMALTQEQCSELANTIPEFIVRPKLKKVPVIKKVLDDNELEKQEIAKIASIGKRLQKQEKKPEATIINNAAKFLKAFRKIIKENVEGATFNFSPESSPQIDLNDKRMAQMVVDKLRAKEALDEEVLLEWMRFTATINAKRKGYISVSAMLNAFQAFEKYIPAPDTLSKRIEHKKTPVVKRKSVIDNSMTNLFKDGFVPKRIIMSCQLWGIPITAQYIVSKTDQVSEKMILDLLKKCTIPEIKGAMSISLKYKSLTERIVLSDWKDKLSDVMAKVGKLDHFEMTDVDRENVIEFVSMFGGVNG
jgi:hypothetical protein